MNQASSLFQEEDRDYMILEYIYGQLLTDSRIPEQERLLVHEETGTWISEIHRIRGTERSLGIKILNCSLHG